MMKAVFTEMFTICLWPHLLWPKLLSLSFVTYYMFLPAAWKHFYRYDDVTEMFTICLWHDHLLWPKFLWLDLLLTICFQLLPKTTAPYTKTNAMIARKCVSKIFCRKWQTTKKFKCLLQWKSKIYPGRRNKMFANILLIEHCKQKPVLLSRLILVMPYQTIYVRFLTCMSDLNAINAKCIQIFED